MSDYAGDISPKQAWDILKADPEAVLVDVRTRPEWAFVGIPDLRECARDAKLISWLVFPDMSPNENFVQEVEATGVSSDAPVLFLCRSGVRSRAAAIALTARGYGKCHNIEGGFEGDPDENRHRGRVNGWKVAGLPWIQQ